LIDSSQKKASITVVITRTNSLVVLLYGRSTLRGLEKIITGGKESFIKPMPNDAGKARYY